MSSSGGDKIVQWQRGVHVFHVPLVSRTFLFLCLLAVVGIVLSAVRSVVGLGFTGMTDAYAWGIWKTFNVMTLTALGSGGFAIGVAAWVFNWKRLHIVMRTALLTSLAFYWCGLLALVFDVGRPWNMWQMLLPTRWNGHSALLEVAVCMSFYAAVFLLFENIPPIYERVYVQANDQTRRRMDKMFPWIKRIYPFMIAAAYVLPALHQSSLGGLLLLAGDKLHPLWQTPALPLLYVLQAGACGTACVLFTLMIACQVWKRPLDPDALSDLGKLLSILIFVFLGVRFVDVAVRGQLGAAFSFDFYSILFNIENLLVAVPGVLLLNKERRYNFRALFLISIVAALGGMMYRFIPTTISFVPGELQVYFPTLIELLMSAGYISLSIVIFSVAVKLLAILPGPLDEWYRAVVWARQHFRTIRVDVHGKASRH